MDGPRAVMVMVALGFNAIVIHSLVGAAVPDQASRFPGMLFGVPKVA